jgi:small subunit ribosomal protein S14
VARKSLIVKASKPAKYATRNVNRCKLCGRSRACMRKFGVCRICFRELASVGRLPGVTKSSW